MENTPKNFDYQVLGKHMCEARKKCNLTQAQMAEILGVSTHYYSSLERGKEYISFPRFAQFLTISKASANELLAGCQEGIKRRYGMTNLSRFQVRKNAVEYPCVLEEESYGKRYDRVLSKILIRERFSKQRKHGSGIRSK